MDNIEHASFLFKWFYYMPFSLSFSLSLCLSVSLSLFLSLSLSLSLRLSLSLCLSLFLLLSLVHCTRNMKEPQLSVVVLALLLTIESWSTDCQFLLQEQLLSFRTPGPPFHTPRSEKKDTGWFPSRAKQLNFPHWEKRRHIVVIKERSTEIQWFEACPEMTLRGW